MSKEIQRIVKSKEFAALDNVGKIEYIEKSHHFLVDIIPTRKPQRKDAVQVMAKNPKMLTLGIFGSLALLPTVNISIGIVAALSGSLMPLFYLLMVGSTLISLGVLLDSIISIPLDQSSVASRFITKRLRKKQVALLQKELDDEYTQKTLEHENTSKPLEKAKNKITDLIRSTINEFNSKTSTQELVFDMEKSEFNIIDLPSTKRLSIAKVLDSE